MELTAETLSSKEFDAIQDDWNRLLLTSAANNIFLRWEWIYTWWTHFSNARELQIIAVRDGAQLVGLVPLYLEKASPFRRSLRFCSDELSPDYVDVIAAPDREIAVCSVISDFLQDKLSWDLCSLENLRSDSLFYEHIIAKRIRNNSRCGHICPYVALHGNFDSYFNERLQSGLKRFHLPKKRRTLFEELGVKHTVALTDADLKIGLAELFRLHDERARTIGRETTFTQPTVQRFHIEVSQLFLKQGFLNLQLLWSGNRAISASYGFNYRQKVYLFQSGFDPEWGKTSAGAVLTQIMIEEAYAKQFTEFDFLKGMENYKSLWANASRPEIEVTAYNNTVGGFMQACAAGMKTRARTLKHALQSSSPTYKSQLTNDPA
jgi:CelD/BcsL family acetyltransferase involved in cellulose biosynthesis